MYIYGAYEMYAILCTQHAPETRRAMSSCMTSKAVWGSPQFIFGISACPLLMSDEKAMMLIRYMLCCCCSLWVWSRCVHFYFGAEIYVWVSSHCLRIQWNAFSQSQTHSVRMCFARVGLSRVVAFNPRCAQRHDSTANGLKMYYISYNTDTWWVWVVNWLGELDAARARCAQCWHWLW